MFCNLLSSFATCHEQMKKYKRLINMKRYSTSLVIKENTNDNNVEILVFTYRIVKDFK